MSSSASLSSSDDTDVSGASRHSPGRMKQNHRDRSDDTGSSEPDSNMLNQTSQRLLNELRNLDVSKYRSVSMKSIEDFSDGEQKNLVGCNCHAHRDDNIERGSSHCWGRVVGIRKLPINENNKQQVNCDNEARNRHRDQQIKLQAEHDEMLTRFNETILKLKRRLKKRDNELDELRRMTDTQSHACRCNHGSEHVGNQTYRKSVEATMSKLEQELGRLDSAIGSREKGLDEQVSALKVENGILLSRIDKQRADFESELSTMRAQMQSMFAEPDVKTVLRLRRENSQLKDINEVDIIEYQTLKEKYRQLETQLKSLMSNYKSMDQDKDKEMSDLFLELCRLQVYQPKLEMTLETERAIRSELQNKLDTLTNENDKLRQQLNDKGSELNIARMESNKNVSGEVSRLHDELCKWQENFHRLKRDKDDVDELLRISNSKIDLMDARHRGELESLREKNGHELDKKLQDISKLESERKRLGDKVSRLERKLADYETSHKHLTDEIMELNKKIPSLDHDDGAKSKLDACEEVNATLRDQLKDYEARNMELVNDNSRYKDQLERARHQLEQVQERFKIQLKAFDEMKAAKDDELSKLRVSLNFERYNRQVALRGIEKELRCTLKELETMKCRFSRRLGAENDPFAGGNKCLRTCCPDSDSSSRLPRSKEAR